MSPVIRVRDQLYDLRDITEPQRFQAPGFTEAIYKADTEDLWKERVQGEIIDEEGHSHPANLKIYQWCQYRLLKLQAALSRYFVNYNTHIEMTLACAIAQEPILFIGPPGVAKTELAISFFGGIGLRKPLTIENINGDESIYCRACGQPAGKMATNKCRVCGQTIPDNAGEMATNKYFEYLLSPFTVPEELFGPLDFKELAKGGVTRINTNMITGRLVRGVFLDEIFNASSTRWRKFPTGFWTVHNLE